jgi:branched-chain amino acid transport system ATP-binding protein
MALLEVKGITKAFGGLLAVDNVDFEVDTGEIISIIGPNGAGKTTIFNMLTGVYTVDSGEIIFDGKPIHNCSPQSIVRAGIARTFQNIRLFPNMRVIENVLVGNHINTRYAFFDLLFRTKRFHEGERIAVQKAVDLLDSIGLGGEIHNYAKNLPYGMQRRLEIARALATDVKLLILDEPAAGMNPQESEDLMAFIRELRGKGYTVLLIEHDMHVVMNISDRVYVIDYGKKISEGLPNEVANNEKVIEAYLGSGGKKRENA